MSIRNLDSLFAPRCVAVLGATDRESSTGATVWRNLVQGFQGKLFAVNPRLSQLGPAKVYGAVADLPEVPDLVVICTPADTVPQLTAELGALGTRAVVVMTAGLSAEQSHAMLQAARRYTLRILGPNSMGLLVPRLGLNASFAHTGAESGPIAFVSQSGALVTAMLDWAQSRGIGFSHFVSLGERADVDVGDLLDYLGSEPHTRAILLYIESIDVPRKFMSAARAAARNKPVIVVRAGRSGPGQRAAASHTGAVASCDEVFDAAISRAGMLRVYTLQHLFMAAELLAHHRDHRGETLTILSNSGGAGVMAADAAAYAGMELTQLAPELLAELDTVLPPNWSHSNPVDIGGDAPAQRYVAALRVLQKVKDSTILLVQAPTASVSSTGIGQALLPLVGELSHRVLGCWLGHGTVAEARGLFRQAGVPVYNTPEEAVRAFAFLRQYHRHQAELLETPLAVPCADGMDLDRICTLVGRVLGEGREWLSEAEAHECLRWAGVPVEPQGLSSVHELTVGARMDPLFGPVILFGQGGAAEATLADRAWALPPLNHALAQALVARTRVGALLRGQGGELAGDCAAITRILITVSQLLAEVPELAELDIPLLQVSAGGVVATGARVRVSRQRPGGAKRFAIRPYPQELVETVPWEGDGQLTLRPIRPEDEAQHLAFLRRLDPEDIRMRVFYSRRSIEHSELARLTQIDYDREMAFIATATTPGGREETLGAVRGIGDPDNDTAEFGVIIRSDLKGKHLGRLLMDKLINYLRANGTRRIVGTVLRENKGMLTLASELGFQLQRDPDDPDLMQVELLLRPAA